MKSLQLITIITRVKTIIDELGVNDANFSSDYQNSNLDVVIRSKIIESVTQVYKTCAWHLLEGKEIPNTLEVNEALYATLQLPSDFLRLISIQLSDWHRSVTNLVQENSPEHAKQNSIHVRGTVDRPVCVFCKDLDGDYLELYSCSSNSSTIKKAVYINIPKINEIDYVKRIDICDKLETAIYYYIASLTLITYADERANSLMSISQSNAQ